MIDKPRIYIAITSFFPFVGGVETQTMAQCQRLLAKGYKTRVVTFQHKKDWKSKEVVNGVPILRVAGTLLDGRRQRARPIQLLLYFLAILVISWTIWKQRKNFDLLQVCQFSPLVLPLSLVCFLARKPMAIVVISAGANKATRKGGEIRLMAGPLDPHLEWLKVDSRGWVNGGDLQWLQEKGKYTAGLTRRLLLRIKAVVIVLSTRMQHYVRENEFKLEIELIPNGVDTARFHPQDRRLDGHDLAVPEEEREKNLRVVCVSNLRYEKGIDVLLQAWYLVQQQQPEARLILVGNGPSKDQLKKLASALNIQESVEFAGNQNDVPAQLHRGNIAILPSRWEGMSNALLEYMSSGQACIATRVSGSEDLIQHRVNGLLVESEDYVGMSQALLTLLQNPELIQRYGEAARQLVEQAYTLEYITNRYLEVYQRLITRDTDKKVDNRLMSHPELLPKFPKQGVQGFPAGAWGVPKKLLFLLAPPVAARKEREKGFLGTPQAPAEGGCPLHSRGKTGWRDNNGPSPIRDDS